MYGIKNCDTVKRARQALEQAQVPYRFHDFRADGVDPQQVETWLERLGEALINRRGTTWRKLDAEQQARVATDPVGLLCENSALMKRPVITKGDEIRIGFAAKDTTSMLEWLSH